MTYEESVKTVPSYLKSKPKNTKLIGLGDVVCENAAKTVFLQLKIPDFSPCYRLKLNLWQRKTNLDVAHKAKEHLRINLRAIQMGKMYGEVAFPSNDERQLETFVGTVTNRHCSAILSINV
ncbi:hypothetical protein BOTNAR_0423g00070 [Botryotinia narcissicola]|uniref:Uncharacterized protein n=1 Tax=Botryotinia narcissicola TaxID=278944 RepID=A0A4Z1HLE9_9HELO|nr:hypothetical protein BOTNAR_0423g00070 [Botryotinia narcissicola]